MTITMSYVSSFLSPPPLFLSLSLSLHCLKVMEHNFSVVGVFRKLETVSMKFSCDRYFLAEQCTLFHHHHRRLMFLHITLPHLLSLVHTLRRDWWGKWKGLTCRSSHFTQYQLVYCACDRSCRKFTADWDESQAIFFLPAPFHCVYILTADITV